jgi:hypothetical protein
MVRLCSNFYRSGAGGSKAAGHSFSPLGGRAQRLVPFLPFGVARRKRLPPSEARSAGRLGGPPNLRGVCVASSPRLFPGFHATALAAAVLGLLAAGIGPALAADSTASHRWLTLGAGNAGAYHWSVKVKRHEGAAGAGPQGARRPCLLVGDSRRVGRFSFDRNTYRQCIVSSDRLTSTAPPLIGTAVQAGGRASSKLTTVGMVFAPAARRVRVTLAGDHTATFRLRKMTPGQARVAKLAPLRYAALVLHGAWCAERVVSESATGKTLWESGPSESACVAEGG